LAQRLSNGTLGPPIVIHREKKDEAKKVRNSNRNLSRDVEIRSVRIVSTSVTIDVKKNKFTTYVVQVECKDNRWYVKRRYNDFYDLGQALKKRYPVTPRLPPKTYRANGLDPDVVRQRCGYLQEFLEKILESPVTSRDNYFLAFLDYGSEHAMHRTIDGVSSMWDDRNSKASSPRLHRPAQKTFVSREKDVLASRGESDEEKVTLESETGKSDNPAWITPPSPLERRRANTVQMCSRNGSHLQADTFHDDVDLLALEHEPLSQLPSKLDPLSTLPDPPLFSLKSPLQSESEVTREKENRWNGRRVHIQEGMEESRGRVERISLSRTLGHSSGFLTDAVTQRSSNMHLLTSSILDILGPNEESEESDSGSEESASETEKGTFKDGFAKNDNQKQGHGSYQAPGSPSNLPRRPAPSYPLPAPPLSPVLHSFSSIGSAEVSPTASLHSLEINCDSKLTLKLISTAPIPPQPNPSIHRTNSLLSPKKDFKRVPPSRPLPPPPPDLSSSP
jgi:hypothetical protein